MSHQSVRSAWDRLTDRLNRFPQGAPPSELLHRILALLFSEREAELVAQLPIKPFTAADASRIWKLPMADAQRTLDALADRAILLDIDHGGTIEYVLPPPMAGFLEFSLMRVREDLDQHLLAELLYQYLNQEEDFIRALFTRGDTQLGRVFVHETAIPPELSLHVLDHERATEVVQTARAIAVGVCYCRHKMQHVGRACAAPMDNCLTFNTSAASLARHGVARAIEPGEALDIIAAARDRRLVQFGENVREGVNFICNCCGCCCEAMIAARRFGHLHPVHTTNYLPEVAKNRCSGCAKCVQACPVEAMALVAANDPARPRRMVAKFDAGACLGCGVCVGACPKDAVRMVERAERVITPVNSTHRVVVMAIERGGLADLIFDNRALFSHRAMAAILGVILRLPPIKQAMASRQVKSRYLERLIARMA